MNANTVQRDLIYDVGLHDGQDSAYYLWKGHRVVAIEANPAFAHLAEQRFRAEIAAGRLTVLNVAVAQTTGRSTFWICDDHSDWSSFDKGIASRAGARHHPVTVNHQPFSDILLAHGLPHYCKVDIEGNDYVCLDALSRFHRPPFISVELQLELGRCSLLERLRNLGYDRFKIIDQARFTTASALFYRMKAASLPAWVQAGLERLNFAIFSCRHDGGWEFQLGSSGTLPGETRGRWLPYHSVRRLIEVLGSQHRRGLIGLNVWFDLHATDRLALSDR